MTSLNLTPLVGTLALCLPAVAQDTLLPGFEAHLLNLPNGASSRTLASGDLVTVDSTGVDLWKADGSFVKNLGLFPAPLFSGVFDVDPTETFALVGRTDSLLTPNPIFRVALDGSGMTPIADVVFNYDGAFAPNGDYFLSAAVGGFGAGNSLLRLDPQTGAVTELARLQGASGPVATDALGNLYYASVSDSFPAPAGSTDVLIFLAADLATADCSLGACLSESAAITYSSGYDGASDLAFDPRTGRPYLLENNFGTGANRIWEVTGGVAATTPLVEGQPFNWMSSLELKPGSLAPELRAFQPAADARLLYTTTDFVSPAARKEAVPARPQLALTGPGTSGAGQVDVSVDGAEPGGGILLLFGPTAGVASSEAHLSLPGVDPPLFTALAPASLQVYGGLLPVDGAGQASLSFINPGGLQGLVTLQALLLDTDLSSILGTSASAPF